ncbi:MAG: VWA domain-containing protein [Planctomycetaceae bacterium]|nr:VWA domain-containing protein [Planctomycetaceae bacterium]
MFHQPIWFLLLIPLFCLQYLRPLPDRMLNVLRYTLLILIVLAMTEPSIPLPVHSGTVIAVADRSLSMPGNSADEQKHLINLLQRYIGKEDNLGIVSFAEKPFPERIPSGKSAGNFNGFTAVLQGDASDLKSAIENAMSLIPIGDKARLLLLSDGRWTGSNPADLIPQLIQRGIAVDYRLQERSAAGDIAIVSVDAPDTVQPNERFRLAYSVQLPVEQEIGYEFFYNGKVAVSGKQNFTAGIHPLNFVVKSGEYGTINCELRITKTENNTFPDPIPENNTARKLIGIEGSKPLLVLSPKIDGKISKLPEILNSAGIKTIATDGSNADWSLPFLSNYSGLIIDNAPSSFIGSAGMERIVQWVKETGTGMMMTGGKNAYALGGYYHSPLDEILPVSMELRTEYRKLAIAVAVLMDCSGSMGMMVPGGKIKMDLANIAAAEVLRILSPMDEVCVMTCDTGVQVYVPLKRNTDPEADINRILRIGPGGGGIFVYTGLLAASRELSNAAAATKHIILFTDADDTEEPREYRTLLENCKKAGMTCSVIALGTERDSTANLCIDIARVGGGNIFFTEKADELPRLFAQDVFTISRSTFLEEPVEFNFTGGITMLTGSGSSTWTNISAASSPPKLGGYNLCYLKDTALAGALSEDEYKAPITAFWYTGLGRVLCYTGQADGPFTGEIANWEHYPAMLVSYAAWTAGQTEELPDGMLLTQTLEDGVCKIRIHLDPERQESTFRSADFTPFVSVLKQSPNAGLTKQRLPLRWTEPDMLELAIPLRGSETVQATLQLSDETNSQIKPFPLPPVCLPYSPEYQPSYLGKGLETLQQLATATGGIERIELTGIWNDIPKVPRYFPLASFLIYAAVVCFVLEIFQRRTNYLSRFMVPSRSIKRADIAKPKRESNEDASPQMPVKRTSIFRSLSMRKQLKQTLSSTGEKSVETQEPVKPPETLPEKKEEDGILGALHSAKDVSHRRQKPRGGS